MLSRAIVLSQIFVIPLSLFHVLFSISFLLLVFSFLTDNGFGLHIKSPVMPQTTECDSLEETTA